MKKEEKGFVASGILYTILIIFLVLMMTILISLNTRKNSLDQLKKNALDNSITVNDFAIGEVVSHNTTSSHPASECTSWYVIGKNSRNNTLKLFCTTKIGNSRTADKVAGIPNLTYDLYEEIKQSNNPEILKTSDYYWMFAENGNVLISYRINTNGDPEEAGGTPEQSSTQNITAYYRPVIDNISVNNVEKSSLVGIPSKTYEPGEIVTYLGASWKVINDNGNDVKMIKHSTLSYDDLMNNFPTDIDSLDEVKKQTISGNKINYCLFSQKKGFIVTHSIYCYENENNEENSNPTSQINGITYEKSIVRAVLQKWITNKISSNGKTITDELIDYESTGDYIGIPQYDDYTSTNCGNTYCVDINNIYYSSENYFFKSDEHVQTSLYSGFSIPTFSNGDKWNSWLGTKQGIKPIITVKKTSNET